ncbi:MAG TPA: CAP domain-containing protein [Candidatus Baltobacteraceae bacterium]|jgi:uncharacterized protein YkwD|nr:CAP domain-containing protein [Candidatus Baltobacteraceae bacterium]
MFLPREEQVHQAEATAATVLYYDLNAERRLRGLRPLELDAQLGEAAIRHVVEMDAGNYFAHESPGGGSPFDRMQAAGCKYNYAGENLAEAPTAEIADSALFASSPHRNNTLSPNYRRVGIAVILDAYGEFLFVEDFTD